MADTTTTALKVINLKVVETGVNLVRPPIRTWFVVPTIGVVLGMSLHNAQTETPPPSR